MITLRGMNTTAEGANELHSAQRTLVEGANELHSSQRTISIPRLSGRNIQLAMLVGAGLLLVLSLLVPYWSITLHAPQYPGGLAIDAFAWKLTGDVAEVDGLNHYIGMIKLEDAAKLERAISRVAIPIIAVLAIASLWLRGRWRWLVVAPALLFPAIFVLDLFVWLYYAGHELDPTAALSSSIKPFTPRLIGEGIIGQFRTTASFGIGFYMALLAAILVLTATWLGRSSDASSH